MPEVNRIQTIPTGGLYAFDLRSQLAITDLSAEVVEAALDQPHPSPRLTASLQALLSFVRHRDRDKARDDLRPPATRVVSEVEE